MNEQQSQKFLKFPEIQKLNEVLLRIAPTREFCIAYSGGLDSRFLAFAAKHLGFKAHLLHIVGPQIAPDETEGAIKDARELGYEPIIVHANSLSLSELADAGTHRCYVCKHHVFSTLKEVAAKNGCQGPVCDGTNTSDLTVYRPGIKALEELHVFSPLAMAGISKPRTREIGRSVGFPNPEQSARPCLLTRFPYGVAPSLQELATLAEAELFVAEDPFGSKLRFRIRKPDAQTTLLHVEKKSLDDLPTGHNGDKGRTGKQELEALVLKLKEKFGERLPGLRAEVLEKLSGYYDRQPKTSPSLSSTSLSSARS